MIDKTLMIPPDGMLLFQAKQFFWLYLFPLLMGFTSVALIQVYSRIGMMRDIKMRTAFLCASAAAMINLWGWAHLARTPTMIPFYGCGVGLAAALMSQIFAIIKKQRTPWKWHLPHVIWKRDVAGVEALKERMRMAA